MIVLIWLFLFIQFNSSFSIYKCPSSFGLFSDPQRCTNYYECENWIPVLKVCGAGLFFNQPKKICDWPDSVDCRSEGSGGPGNNYGVNTQTTNIGNINHIAFICHADGLYEDPVSCNHFVECSQGSPFRKVCPSGLHFDIRIKACNWPESMECTKHTKPLITERPPSLVNQPNNRPDYSTPKYSTPKYVPYQPQNTPEPDNYETPPKELIDDTRNQNFQPDSKPSSMNDSNCEWCFKCPNLEDKYYENKFDKLTYYHCYKAVAYLMYCPRNEIWVQEKQTCKSEKLNESLNNVSSEDGAGLIDMRTKPKGTILKPTNKKRN